jgi:hypothetical protein
MFDSDEESVKSSSSSSSEDNEPSPPSEKSKQSSPRKSHNKPEMKIISSSSKPFSSAAVNDNSFQSLLAGHSDRQQPKRTVSESRPLGEMQMSWKLEKKKASNDAEARVEGQQSKSNGTRRSASKNVFRRIKR